MTLKEIDNKIKFKQLQLNVYKSHINSSYGSNFMKYTEDKYRYICELKSEIRKLIPIKERLEKINKLLVQ